MHPPTPWTATWPLAHLAMVTYPVPADRVVPFLPASVALDTRTNEQGEEIGFISAVMFLNDSVKLAPLPWPTITFLQVNYRAYVHYKGEPAVWFFQIAQDSAWAGLNNLVFGLPSLRAPMGLKVRWNSSRGTYQLYRFQSVSPHHKLHVDIEGLDEQPAPGPLFSSPQELAIFLTSRPNGLYYEPGWRAVSSIGVWHKTMHPKQGTVREASFSVLDDLGLVPYSEQVRPYSVLLQHADVMLARLPHRGILRVPKPGLASGPSDWPVAVIH